MKWFKFDGCIFFKWVGSTTVKLWNPESPFQFVWWFSGSRFQPFVFGGGVKWPMLFFVGTKIRRLEVEPLQFEGNLLRSPQRSLWRSWKIWTSNFLWHMLGGSAHLVPACISNLGHLEGEQPQLGDLLTMVMVINHLQVLGWSSKYPFDEEVGWGPRSWPSNSTVPGMMFNPRDCGGRYYRGGKWGSYPRHN